MAKIQHIAIMVEDPDKLAAFYKEVFGMWTHKDHQPGGPGEPRAVFLTDGHLELALISGTPFPKGINHFGFTIDPKDEPAVRERLKKHNIEPFTVNPGFAYAEVRAKDLEGNSFDLSTTGLRMDAGQHKPGS